MGNPLVRGTVVKVPLLHSKELYLVFVEGNRFGSTFGVLENDPLVPASESEAPGERLPFLVVVHPALIQSGRWTIVGCSPNLVAAFPPVEVFYPPDGFGPFDFGPYGLAEDLDGNVRKLKKAESVFCQFEHYETVFLGEEAEAFFLEVLRYWQSTRDARSQA